MAASTRRRPSPGWCGLSFSAWGEHCMTSRRAELWRKSNYTNQPRRMPGRLAPFPTRLRVVLMVLVLAAVGWEAYVQDLEPRAYTNTPVGLNVLLAGYAYSESNPPRTASSEPFLLAPPKEAGPVVVRARFEWQDINEINDGAETFEFTGVLTLTWQDPRQAFDPAVVGVDEKIFQGAYQVNELATGWFPQVVLVNASGLYQQNGVVLRVQPDGTSTLIGTLNATAKAEFNMRRFPFDGQRLEAVFEVLGFDRDEVLLHVASEAASTRASDVRLPQWTVTGARASVRERAASYAGRRGVSSAFVVSVDVQRESFYLRRLVVIPLVLVVLLSFSVFWMDRSSLGDRLSVSFIGILTAVAYQLVMSEQLPRISYVTLMHGFLNLSFLTMCATVVINLVVGTLDRRGKSELGDRIDRRCRWVFPIAYVGLLLVMFAVAILFF